MTWVKAVTTAAPRSMAVSEQAPCLTSSHGEELVKDVIRRYVLISDSRHGWNHWSRSTGSPNRPRTLVNSDKVK